MSYNIGDNPTSETAVAVGDKVKIHDISAEAEKVITVANLKKALNAYQEETFTITTGTPDYTITEASGRNVWLVISVTNDVESEIDFPAAGMADGQKIRITFADAITADGIFTIGGATGIVTNWTAAVSAGQTFEWTYNLTTDTWYGGILALA